MLNIILGLKLGLWNGPKENKQGDAIKNNEHTNFNRVVKEDFPQQMAMENRLEWKEGRNYVTGSFIRWMSAC